MKHSCSICSALLATLVLSSLVPTALPHPLESRQEQHRFPTTFQTIPNEDEAKTLARARKMRAEFDAAHSRAAAADLKVGVVSHFDWRNVSGKNYVTTVKNQDPCGACEAFAVTAQRESMYLTSNVVPAPPAGTPATMPDFSEAHLYFCLGGQTCGSGWYETGAIEALKQGLYDESCMPWTDNAAGCSTFSCGQSQNWVKNGTGVLARVYLYTWESIKNHIQTRGPVLTGFWIYSDFPGGPDSNISWSFGPDYVWPGTKTGVRMGGHAVTCYGYDDNMLIGNGSSTGVVFCKNSWGSTWGDNGHFKVAYGADAILSTRGHNWGLIYHKPTSLCATNNGGCNAENATCAENGSGGVTCTCNQGYYGDGHSCLVDSCFHDSLEPDAERVCLGPHVRCIKLGEGFTCGCDPGYVGISAQPRNLCVEDQCKFNNGGCHANATCYTTGINSTSCYCSSGYTGDGKTCRKLACFYDWWPCSDKAGCTENPDGTAHCECFGGYVGDGKNCTADPCGTGNSDCSPWATCTNTGGMTWKCACRAGFTGDGKTCVALPPNPCLTNNGGCASTAAGGVCTNNNGNAVCSCKNGYTGNGLTCTSKCLVSNGGCSKNATCSLSTMGAVSCTCKPGYKGNGLTCTSKCLINNGGCSKNATCSLTTSGTVSCACKPNYYGTGFVCTPKGTVKLTVTAPIATSRRGFKITLTATALSSGKPVSGLAIVFQLGTGVKMTALTNTKGIARVSYLVPLSTALGRKSFSAVFAGNAKLLKASASGVITVGK